MKYKLAKLLSDVFNPFLLGFIVIILVVLHDTGSFQDALKWVGISLALSVVPVFIVVLLLVKQKKLDGLFNSPREQRTVIYLVSVCTGIIGLIMMWVLNAPPFIKASFTAGVLSILLFMGVNFFWKISLHTAFAAASATVITILYGVPGAFAFLVVPPVIWSRVTLKQHTVWQVVAGGTSAAAIVAGVFWLCGCY